MRSAGSTHRRTRSPLPGAPCRDDTFSMLPMTPLDSPGGAAGVWLGVLDLPAVVLVAEGLANPAQIRRTASVDDLLGGPVRQQITLALGPFKVDIQHLPGYLDVVSAQDDVAELLVVVSQNTRWPGLAHDESCCQQNSGAGLAPSSRVQCTSTTWPHC